MSALARSRTIERGCTPRVSAPRRAMAKIVVHIPYINWRDGRPRYVAAPKHRELGYKGEDLKHPDGTWFDLEEAKAWSEARIREYDERRQEVKRGRSAARVAAGAPAKADGYTVAQLFSDWQSPRLNPRFGDKVTMQGKRRIKPLAANTREFYRRNAKIFEELDDGAIWARPAAQLTRKAASGIYDRLAEQKGIAVARAAIATLSAAWSWAHNKGKVGPSPLMRLGMETPEARLRVGSIEEMKALIAAGDELGRPEISDSVMLGLMSGQRQADRLNLAEGGRDLDGRLLFRQIKTGAVVLVPSAPMLAARLAAARDRRRDAKVHFPEIVIDETAGRPFKRSWYSHVFADVRDAAVKGIEDVEATAAARDAHCQKGRNTPPPIVWKVEPCPSLTDFTDQDLRDTAVTWMALAGATIPEIISVTGHSVQSAQAILKHYLGRHPEMAASAIGKAVAWLEAKGGL